MKDLWTDRSALWLDTALTVAAVLSPLLRLIQMDSSELQDAWWWVRLVPIVLPLLLLIRRFEPAVVLPGLICALYLGGYFREPPWPLYAGLVVTLWSLAYRYRPAIVLAVAAVCAALPYPVNALRDVGDGYYDDQAPYLWPQWLSPAIILLTLAFLAIRHRRQAEPISAQQRRAALQAVFQAEENAPIRYVVLALTFASLIFTEVGRDLNLESWWSAPAWMPFGVAVAGLTLVMRRRRMIPVLVLAAASLISNWQASEPYVSLYVAFGVSLYLLIVSPKSSRSLRWTLPTAIGLLAVLPVITRVMRVRYLQLIFPEIKRNGWDYTYNGVLRNTTYDGIAQHLWPISLSLLLLIPVLVAIGVRQYRRNREATQREAELEQVAEELEAEQVVLTERSIIARDLHDVVAHAVNLMVIQAETGPDLVRRGEADVLAGFQRIGDAGRRALSELDRLLSTLRDEDGIADPQLAPQPGLSDLSQLVADVSEDHLPIELDLQGDLTTPPEGQQLTAYRLVQEALTNVVKHAKATGVRVVVRSEEAGVRVEVTDDGVGFDVAAARRGNRHGLAGMRERVRIEGGQLDIRSTPGAGTTVAAWIPVGGRR